jgi:hypothetical protein
MIRRVFYLMFVVVTGGVGALVKWLFMGTRGGRQRQKIIKQQKRLLRQQGRSEARPATYVPVAPFVAERSREENMAPLDRKARALARRLTGRRAR